MKGLLANYSDSSDSDSEQPPKPVPSTAAKRSQLEKPVPKLKQPEKPSSEPKPSFVPPEKVPEILPFGDAPAPVSAPPVEDDSGSESEGDFVKKAKKAKLEAPPEETTTTAPAAATAKPEIEGLDPIAKSLFSVLPAPKNKRRMDPVILPKVKQSVKGSTLIRDEGDQDFLLSYSNVQLPKAEVKYSTDEAPKQKVAFSATDKGDDLNEKDVIEIDERDMRDESWRMNYMRGTDGEQTQKMEEYLKDHPVGQAERSKNQITHLAFQAMKQQMSQRFANTQKMQKDGRKKYGW